MNLFLDRLHRKIAEILYISSRTIRVHVHAILIKLNVRDRKSTVVVAIQKKLIVKV
ncbi:MAG: LuxR C-terminal-related transcriptional regulator [Xenococcaceae cyanobacterium]